MKTSLQKEKLLVIEQFLLLSQCFKNLSAAEASESIYIWERVKVCMGVFREITGKGSSMCHLVTIFRCVSQEYQLRIETTPRLTRCGPND